jgi:hypothetical protein
MWIPESSITVPNLDELWIMLASGESMGIIASRMNWWADQTIVTLKEQNLLVDHHRTDFQALCDAILQRRIFQEYTIQGVWNNTIQIMNGAWYACPDMAGICVGDRVIVYLDTETWSIRMVKKIQ